jgi:hypothetical protein
MGESGKLEENGYYRIGTEGMSGKKRKKLPEESPTRL